MKPAVSPAVLRAHAEREAARSTEIHLDIASMLSLQDAVNMRAELKRVSLGVTTARFASTTSSQEFHAEMIEAIAASKTLEQLHVECNIGNHSKALAAAVLRCATLKRLSIVNSSIENTGAEALAQAVAAPTSKLEELDLSGNRIGGVGCAALCWAAAHHLSLQLLYLSHNRFGDEVAQTLALLLAHSKTLRRLYVYRNHFTQVSEAILAKGIRASASIEEVALSSPSPVRLGLPSEDFLDDVAASRRIRTGLALILAEDMRAPLGSLLRRDGDRAVLRRVLTLVA